MSKENERNQASETKPLPGITAMAGHARDAAHLLKALANEHRLLILCHLADGEKSVSELNERVPLSQSALSQHLSVLRRDGLVETRRESQNIFYRLAEGPANRVVATLHDVYCCGGGVAG